MVQKHTNRIRSFHAPEKPRLAPRPQTSVQRAPIQKRRSSSFSHKRFNNSNNGFGAADNHKSEVKEAPETLSLPPVGDNIRIIPLGGVEEIGKNMTLVEIGDDIIVIDAGFQFRDEDTPGVDYILPNTKYLEERKDKIRGVIITHGHFCNEIF
jgi:ribonuclease J